MLGHIFPGNKMKDLQILSFVIKSSSKRDMYSDENKDAQKEPLKGVLEKRCSENTQQIYRRTPMPKCEVRFAKQLY